MMIITVIRKPLVGSVCENITSHNIGGINIHESRIGTEGGRTNKGGYQNSFVGGKVEYNKGKGVESDHSPKGRWPANILLSDESVVEIMNDQSGDDTDGASRYFKTVKENE